MIPQPGKGETLPENEEGGIVYLSRNSRIFSVREGEPLLHPRERDPNIGKG
jgi:hypothetical protein